MIITDAYKGLTFDDVTLSDGMSLVKSRQEVELVTDINGKKAIPIIAASMESINSVAMGTAMLNKKMCYIHHRYCSFEDRLNITRQIKENHNCPEGLLGIAVGYKDLELLEKADLGHLDIISLDVAGCYNQSAIDFSIKVDDLLHKRYNQKIHYMIGNYSNSGFLHEYQKQVQIKIPMYYKTSQGGGSVCTTRIATGVGIPTFGSTLVSARTSKNIVSDGGIRNPGDMLKCFVAGARMVMIGSLLAGHDECENPNLYSGMASSEAKLKANMEEKNVEGVTVSIKAKNYSVNKTLDYITESLQSGISLLGHNNLQSAIKDTMKLVMVSPSAYREAKPHKEG